MTLNYVTHFLLRMLRYFQKHSIGTKKETIFYLITKQLRGTIRIATVRNVLRCCNVMPQKTLSVSELMFRLV